MMRCVSLIAAALAFTLHIGTAHAQATSPTPLPHGAEFPGGIVFSGFGPNCQPFEGTLSFCGPTANLDYTPYNATNPAGYVNAAAAAAAAPVQSVASRTGAITLTHSDLTDWSSAWAATLLTNIGIAPSNAAPGCSQVTGGLACRSAASVNADVFNVRDFGAVGDGMGHPLYSIGALYQNGSFVNTSSWTLTNWQTIYPAATATGNHVDGLAISLAIQTAAAKSAEAGTIPVKVVIPMGDYEPNTSINATNFRGPGAMIDGGGSVIHSTATGQIAFDALGTEQENTANITIDGDATNVPSYLFVDGRTASHTNNQSDTNVRSNIKLIGSASVCSLLSSQDEESIWTKLYVSNGAAGTAGAGPYAGCIDGVNHYAYAGTGGQISQYVTFANPPQDTTGSFNHFTCNICNFSATGGGAPLWISFLQGPKINGYLFQNSATNPYAVVWYNINGGDSKSLDFRQLHAENTSINYRYFITGPKSTGGCTNFTTNIEGFYDDDHGDHSQLAMFKVDPASCVTGVNMTDAHIHIGGFAAGSANPALVADPALWSMTGRVELPSLLDWLAGAPANNQVTLCQNTPYNPAGTSAGAGVPTQMCFPFGQLPTEAHNPKFDLDRLWGHAQTPALTAGAMITDGWSYQTVGAASDVKFTNTIGTSSGAPLDAAYNLLATTSTAVASLPSNTYASMRQLIEAPWLNQLSFGDGNALPFVIDFWARSSVTGVGTVAFSNSSMTRSYVQPFTVAAANIWQRYSFIIPGDAVGAWLHAQNSVGLYMSFPLAAGSNFQIAPNVWTTTMPSSVGLSVPGAINFLSAVNENLQLADVELFPTPNDQELQPRAIDQEIARANHFFQSSFPANAVPGQNVCTSTPAACTGSSPNQVAIGALTTFVPLGAAVGTILPINVTFPEEFFSNSGMTLPTVTTFDPASASASCRDVTAGIDMGTPVIAGLSSKSMTVGCPLAAGFTAGDVIQVHYSAAVVP